MKKFLFSAVAFLVMVQIQPVMLADIKPNPIIVDVETNLKDCSIPIGYTFVVYTKGIGEDGGKYDISIKNIQLTVDNPDLCILDQSSFTLFKAGSTVVKLKVGDIERTAKITSYELKSIQINVPDKIFTGDTFKASATITDSQGNIHEPVSAFWTSDSDGNFSNNNNSDILSVWAASGKMKIFCLVNSHWKAEKEIDILRKPGESLIIDIENPNFYVNAFQYRFIYLRNIGSKDIPLTCSLKGNWLEMRQIPTIIKAGETKTIALVPNYCFSTDFVVMEAVLSISTPSKEETYKLRLVNNFFYKDTGSCNDMKFDMVEAGKISELELPILGKPGSRFKLESENPRFTFDQNGYEFPIKIDGLAKIKVDTKNPPKDGNITGKITIIPNDNPEKTSTFKVECKLVQKKSTIILEKDSDIAIIDGNEYKMPFKTIFNKYNDYWQVPFYFLCQKTGINIERLTSQRSLIVSCNGKFTFFFDNDSSNMSNRYYETRLFDFDAKEFYISDGILSQFFTCSDTNVGNKRIIEWVTEPFKPEE